MRSLDCRSAAMRSGKFPLSMSVEAALYCGQVDFGKQVGRAKSGTVHRSEAIGAIRSREAIGVIRLLQVADIGQLAGKKATLFTEPRLQTTIAAAFCRIKPV